MSVYQKDNGKWYCRGRVNGKRYHCLCDGADSKTKAVAQEDGIRFQIRQEQLGLAKKEEKKTIYTIEKLTEKYLEYSKSTQKATFDKDVTHTTFFKKFFGKKTDIETILPSDIERMRIYLKTTHKNKRGEPISDSTINRYYSSLQTAFNVMIKNKYIKYNPCNEVVKYSEDDNKRDVILPLEVQEKFLELLPSNLHRVIILVALNTGYRKENVLCLQKSQINFDKEIIILPKSKNKGKKTIITPINSLLIGILQFYSNNTDDYLFINPKTNEPYKSILKSVKSAARKVGIENFIFHDLRRTFGTRLLENGVNIRVIQELLAHSSVAVTQRYLPVKEQGKIAALESLVA